MTSTSVRPTAPEEVPVRRLRRNRDLRRIGVGALGAVVALGVLNVLGVRTAAVSGSAGRTSLEIRYAAVTRPGLATPWSAIVHRDGGFEGDIVIATTADYFSGFDFNQLYPEPRSTTRRDDEIVMTFDAPAGESFRVDLDGRTSPTIHLGGTATTRVWVAGEAGPSLSYRTWVMP